MKNILALLFFLGYLITVLPTTSAQYYLKGEVKDEKGNVLSDVRINLSSKGRFPYTSGSSGTFGIPCNVLNDTIFLFLEGYDDLKKAIKTNQFQSLVMQPATKKAPKFIHKLTSHTSNLIIPSSTLAVADGETYTTLVENNIVSAKQYPETGFSLNVDRASYSNIRRFINNELQVPPDAVRIEEMLNYFDFRNENIDPYRKNFTCNTVVTDCPWNNDNRLFFVKLDAPKINMDSVPPSNLVFLIDVSGSMDKPNRLPLIQAAFKLLVENLRDKDTVSIVTYGGGVSVVLPPTSGSKKIVINNVIDALVADGETPGENAIRIAYKTAKRAFIKNGNNRVIMATDGDFNVGQTSEKDLEDLIVQQRSSGIYLTCIGVGMGDYKDSKLEVLAKKGNGNFAYLDNIGEAEKVLVTEFTKTIYAVANDAYLNVQFDPNTVKNYRLIGFDNKRDATTDINSQLEGGEVGSGHSVLAVFEITPQSDAGKNNRLLARLQLKYTPIKSINPITQYFNAIYNFHSLDSINAQYGFATSVVMFGSILKNSVYAKTYSIGDVISLATLFYQPNNYLQKEFIKLMQKAEKIYTPNKKPTRIKGKL